MRKIILILLILLLSGYGLARGQVMQQSKIDKAPVLLSNARLYFEEGDYIKAEKLILEVLTVALPGSKIRAEAEILLRDIISKINEEKQKAIERMNQKHRALLDKAKDLSSKGKFEQASRLLKEILIETNNPLIIKEIENNLLRPYPRWDKSIWPRVRRFIYSDIFLIFLCIVAIYLIFLISRAIWTKIKSKKWLIGINDKTGMGIGELVTSHFFQWSKLNWKSSVSVGLRILEMPQIASAPIFSPFRLKGDLMLALESFPRFGSLDIGAIAKIFSAIRRWMNAKRPQIVGVAYVSGEQTIVRLTCRDVDGRIKTVTASHKISLGVDASAHAAEAASFKMYYLIAKESNIVESEVADKLRKALKLLQMYTSSIDPNALKRAHEAFCNIRKENPAIDEASLHEGIALDLMEQHDAAINLFENLAQHSSNEEIREKAHYNEAISRFRKYQADELEEAIKILNSLVGQRPDLIKHPIKALGLAAKANVIAHKPIFWQRLLFKGTKSLDEKEVLRRRKKAKQKVDEWIWEVEKITEELEASLSNLSKDDKVWDDMARRQLEWAIQNARGNVYLYYAINFLVPIHLLKRDELDLRNEYLNKAHSFFQKCETLLPPGVEALCNIATALLHLSRTDDARGYAQRAIDLNSNYEYAYYRLAQCWEKDNKKDKVAEVLNSFLKIKDPRIPQFKELFKKYL